MNKLEKQENDAIAMALENGHHSPLLDADHRKMLYQQKLDKDGNVIANYRRFIVEFDYISPNDVTSDKNVRSDVVDEQWCKESLAPRLAFDNKIYDPIMTTRKGKTESCLSGNNRVWSSKLNWRSREVPRFLLDDVWYAMEINENGKEAVDFSQQIRSPLFDLRAAISTNPPIQSSPYKLIDCADNLNKLFEADATFGGINPSGGFPERGSTGGIYETICDNFLGGHYPNKSERTKIYNKWNNLGNTKSKTKAVDAGTITENLANAGWTTGVDFTKGSKKRKSFWDNYDSVNNTYIANVTTNAKKIEEKLLLTIIEKEYDGELTRGVNISVHLTIDKAPPTLVTLKERQKAALRRIDRVNDILSSIGSSHRIVMVMAAKQLVDPNDRVTIYTAVDGEGFVQDFIRLNPVVEDNDDKQLKLVGLR